MRSTHDDRAYPPPSLLGLPRAQRLEAVGRDDVRAPVQQAGEVPAEVGVPGVRVHDVGPGAVPRHRQVDAERAQGGVGAGEPAGSG
ncbi:hypothetical protein GCM10025868_01840 [Angustibacter aerolatus]|uniref:Uncharacterized protein n=1 Tax=Angustibacter aerolatus TaxID=1162965 RepID=A0ABQ6JCK8_9ACTN|nr:hypothetical protein GCM10025868_01840 [Angustibacter aerolatus]